MPRYIVLLTQPDHFARRIDTQLAPPLFDMLNQISQNQGNFPIIIRELLTRLAVRNLLRGYSLALPTGQAVAEELGITPLDPAQLTSGNTASFNKALTDGNFETATPLWYYVLKEAEVLANGNSLGPVGSRIVVETLIGQLRADAGSFLNAPGGWSPEQGVLLPDGTTIDFDIDPFAKMMLLAGTDELGYLMAQEPELAAWEAAHPPRVDTRTPAVTS